MTPAPRVKLSLDLACNETEARLFIALVIYLFDLENGPNARPQPSLDKAMGNNARAVIAEITPNLTDFGIEAIYDSNAAMLKVRDIDGKPNPSALSLILLWLFPTRLPIAFKVSSPIDPDKPIWTIVDRARIIVTDNEEAVQSALSAASSHVAAATTETFH